MPKTPEAIIRHQINKKKIFVGGGGHKSGSYMPLYVGTNSHTVKFRPECKF